MLESQKERDQCKSHKERYIFIFQMLGCCFFHVFGSHARVLLRGQRYVEIWTGLGFVSLMGSTLLYNIGLEKNYIQYILQ